MKDLVSRLIKEGREQQHDVGSLGLKTVIQDTPPGSNESSIICDNAIPDIVSFLQKGASSTSTENECLDILTTIAGKYTTALAEHHRSLKEIIFLELDGNKAGVRKRAMHCLAAMAPHLHEILFNEACDALINGLNYPSSADAIRTYVQATAFVARSAGFRFGPYVGSFMPTIVRHCRNTDDGDELKEYVLYSIEACTLRSPREVKRFFDDVVNLSKECLTYDPNYEEQDDDEDEHDGGMAVDNEDEEDEEDEIDDDDVGSDDDDESWKVRRAAAKCCAALISQYPDMLQSLYKTLAPLLLKRFNEREESVKIEVVETFQVLLRKTVSSTSAQSPSGDASQTTSAPLQCLVDIKEKILKASIKQLRARSLKTRNAIFRMLKHLLYCQHAALHGYLNLIANNVSKTLADRSGTSSIRIEVLEFVQEMMKTHDSGSLDQCLSALAGAIFAATDDKYFKVKTHAIMACDAMIHLIRPRIDGELTVSGQEQVEPLYTTVSQKLLTHDQDQEVKEAAITCVSHIVANLGDQLSEYLETCLNLLLERLRNETTRLVTVRAFETIATSQLISLGSILQPLFEELISFLRKAMRSLRMSSLSTLESLVRYHGNNIHGETINTMVQEAATLITSGDLSLAASALSLCIAVLETRMDCASSVAKGAVPGTTALLSSSNIFESTVQVLQRFYEALAVSGAEEAEFSAMLDQLLNASNSSSRHHVFHCIGRCISGLCQASGNQRDGVATAQTLLERFNNLEQKTLEAGAPMLLVAIGEIGKDCDLGSVESLLETLQYAMNLDEDVRNASAYALGCIAVGSTKNFLPTILQAIQNGASNKYALMGALREVVAEASRVHESEMVQVRDILTQDMDTEDDHLRGVVSECCGRLALKAPSVIVPELKAGCGNIERPNIRLCAVTAIRFSLHEATSQSIDEHLDQNIEEYLALIEDENRFVRHAAIQTFSAVLHYKTHLIKDKLDRLLPKLYGQATVKPELVREVNLGPFTHKVDEGLDIRKAAYGCMDRLVQRTPGRIEPNAFLERLAAGLLDESDVRQTCHIILQRLPAAEPFKQPLLGRLDSLVQPLRKTIFARLKKDAVKQELDRHDDLVRSAMRAVASIERMPGSESCIQFKELLDAIKQGEQKERFLSIRQELENSSGA